MTTKAIIRNVLHPIVGLFLGYWWLSHFGGWTTSVVGNSIVSGLFGFLCIGTLGAFYELFEKKYAEAIPSISDIISIGIGGAIGGILYVSSPKSTFFEYGFYISLLVGIVDVILIIRKFNKK